MKSLIFSNFSDKFFEEELRSKLETAGIEIVCVVKPEESTSLEADEFDVIIAFQDMTIKSQQNLMKEFAKKAKKPISFLLQRNPNFENELIGVAKKLSSLPPSETTVNTMTSVVDLMTNPKSSTTSEKDSLSQEIRRLRKLLEEKDGLIALSEVTVREGKKIINIMREAAEDKNGAFAETNEYIKALEDDNERLSSELRTAQEAASSLLIERDLALKEFNNSVAGNRFLKEKVDRLTFHRNNGNNIRQEILSIHKLHQEKIITDSEALNRLFRIGEDTDGS